MGLSLTKPQKLYDEGFPTHINSILALYLVDVGLETFTMHPLVPNTIGLGAWINRVGSP